MTIEITEHNSIKFFMYKGSKYITAADLERLTGLKAITTRQWKNRDKIKEGKDYMVLENPHLVLINTKSKFINNELIKRGSNTIH